MKTWSMKNGFWMNRFIYEQLKLGSGKNLFMFVDLANEPSQAHAQV